jgi:NAD-dependent deacetylase
MSSTLADLTRALRDTAGGQILFVTGAGVSLASGIPTFRGSDPDAIWKQDVTELGTHHFFREDPAGSWHFYLTRFSKVEGARPNPAHHALAALERWQAARGGGFLLVTQNIDTLHEQAGSSRLVKVHGTSDRFRCDREGCALGAPKGSLPAAEVDLAPFRQDPVRAHVPRCPRCGAFLRMHVLWFDEYYSAHEDYRFDVVMRAAQREAKVVVFAGTSFAVGVTDLVLSGARGRGVPIFNIDPTPRIDERGVQSIAMPAEVALVEVARELGVEVHEPGQVG